MNAQSKKIGDHAVQFATGVDENAHVRLEAPVGGSAGGVVEEPVVVAGHEDDGLLQGIDPREGVHRAALDVAADADGVGLVDDRLRGGGGNVAVEVGEEGEEHFGGIRAARAVPLARRGMGGVVIGQALEVTRAMPARQRATPRA